MTPTSPARERFVDLQSPCDCVCRRSRLLSRFTVLLALSRVPVVPDHRVSVSSRREPGAI